MSRVAFAVRPARVKGYHYLQGAVKVGGLPFLGVHIPVERSKVVFATSPTVWRYVPP